MSDGLEKPVALITGATGFVGAHLAHRLQREGWRVEVLTRPQSKLPAGSEFRRMTNHVHDGSTEGMTRCIGAAKPDVVFHLASLVLPSNSEEFVEPLISSNVLFGTQLLAGMQANGVKYIVNTGTFWQHYDNQIYDPVCLYAATKQAFEAMLGFYVNTSGIRAITLTLFDTYGPDDQRPKLFELLNRCAETGEALDMSAGAQLIDLVHIDDVVDAYLLGAKRLLGGQVSRHERYAVSSERRLPLKELVQLYAEVSGQNFMVNWGARAYRTREVMVPWNHGVTLPGWSQKVSLEQGMLTVVRKQC